MVAAAIGAAAVGGIASSAIGASASKSAANTQAQAAQNASQLQYQMFQQLQQNQQPYMQLGSSTIPQLQSMLGNGSLSQQFSFNPTMQQLEQTPGYQFTLNQGEQAINNQMAAQGLNLSGPQAMALSNYATGLASNTYQQQYQNALQNFQTNYNVNANQYSRLSGLVGLGQNAAAGVGNAGIQTGTNMANTLMSGANASAAGTVGAANAASSGISSLGSSGLMYALLNPSAASGSIYGSAASTSTPEDLIAGYTG